MIFLDLFWTFFKIGLFTFGGGYAMLPLIQAAVEEKGWLGAEELLNFIAVSESTPGPFAVNISTYIGSRLGGIPGAACATLGVALPSLIIILLVARFYARFRESRWVKGVMSGLKPAVIGLIAAALLSLGRTVFFPDGLGLEVLGTPVFLVSLGIFLLTAVLAFKKVHPILLVLLSAALGIGAGYLLL
ncbi:MAG: chromate transporter [Oscillospiraceae bacterium]|nr:chromate transporter [Oscillospiraceae bacterium]